MSNPIVVECDPAWPREFESLTGVLAEALGSFALAIHHIGSTAIPGMIAKPTLDIDVELAPNAKLEDATAVLASIGYDYEGDLGIVDRHAYRAMSDAVPLCLHRQRWPHHHLYVCPHGSRELERHLKFRDSLRNSDALRQEYIQIKRDTLRRAKGDRRVYADEKAQIGEAFFRKVLDL